MEVMLVKNKNQINEHLRLVDKKKWQFLNETVIQVLAVRL
jgi:hypothetical protein